MNWLLAYLLFFILIIALIAVTFRKGATWKSRMMGWGLLLLPVIIFMWDYPVVYYQHVRDCKAEGGLKVLIQPKKAEQVQFRSDNSSSGESKARGILYSFYPRLKKVEATGDSTESVTIPNGFYSYSVVSKNHSKYLNDWTFDKKPTPESTNDIYVISSHREDTKSTKNRITKYEWTLTRNGQLYAKIVNYTHFWAGIQYPDAVPSWSCWDGQREKYEQPEGFLIKLILK